MTLLKKRKVWKKTKTRRYMTDGMYVTVYVLYDHLPCTTPVIFFFEESGTTKMTTSTTAVTLMHLRCVHYELLAPS